MPAWRAMRTCRVWSPSHEFRGVLAEMTNAELSNRIIKVNHAGEYGAINIYEAQLMVARLFRRAYVPLLEDLIAHERRHLDIFGKLLAQRGVPRCRSYILCGTGGFVLGIVTSLLGKRGVMACTAAVESVVTTHLQQQLKVLADIDSQGHEAVASILADEEEHLELGLSQGGDGVLLWPVRVLVGAATESVIWLGMRI